MMLPLRRTRVQQEDNAAAYIENTENKLFQNLMCLITQAGFKIGSR